MLITAGKHNATLTFRLSEEMKRKFSIRHPNYTKRGKILRELLRMYVDGEIKNLKTTEVL